MTEVARAARQRRKTTFLYANVHCVNVARHDRTYRTILQSAELVYCDGTGVQLGCLLAGMPVPERMTGADWIDDLCHLAVKEELTLFLLGGAAGSAEDAAQTLRRRHPGLRIAGTEPGYDVTPETIDRVNRAHADILLVGMGTPRQETWIEAHRVSLNPPVVWAVGALFDFVSGRIPRGPRLLTEHGFEWLCRLVAEPRKLWRRYLIGNPLFVWAVIREYRLSRHQEN
jgi:N-acetylglucosaminyldiphosphoundecaprenol N-acetyl-beta-D-mannosaminyltransferase